MCIKQQEWHEYFPEGSKYWFGNAYYHFNSSCVKLHHPQFVPLHLEIPTDRLIVHAVVLTCMCYSGFMTAVDGYFCDYHG